MGDVNKIDDVAIGSVNKVNDVAKSSIAKMNDVTVAAAAAGGLRVAMVVGAAGEYYWSTSSNLATVGDWHLVDLGSSVNYDIAWGYDSDGNEAWVMATNQTARPIRVAVSDGSDNWVPSASANWEDVDPSGIRDFPTYGYECHYHPNAVTQSNSASWTMSGVNNSSYAYYLSGSMTDPANWNTEYRGFDASGTNSAIRGPVSNGSGSTDGVYVLHVVTTAGDLWVNHSGGLGNGDDTPAEWERVYSTGTNRQKSAIGYGLGKWVVAGSGTAKHHLTSSNNMAGAKGMEWGDLPQPGTTNRVMNGVATDMSGNWILCGDTGYFWASDDNAASWTESKIPSTDGGTTYRPVKDIAYDNNGTWLAAGERSFYVSTNNGSSWVSFDISATTNRTYRGVAFNVHNTSQ